jgi:hypothetical protein
VTAGTDLTGGGTSGTVTLNVDTTKVPTLGASSNVFTGSITASAFAGNGANVTNVNAAELGGLLPAAFQPAGSYAVTTGANSFAGTQTVASGDVAVSSGNLDLPQTTAATTGVVTLGGIAFLHACCSASQYNTFVGLSAGNFTTSSYGGNTAIGYEALYADTTGGGNTASGYQALYSNTLGGGNTASGYYALYSNTTGVYNIASGFNALYSNTTGSYNVASGYQALVSNTTGSDNVASGLNALAENSTGSNNTAIGDTALTYNCHVVSTGCTANYNTALGYQAGGNWPAYVNETGSNNTFIGANSGPGSTALTNATAIGANAPVSESNALVLGSINGVNGAAASVDVGIGTATPGQALDVVGNIRASGCVYYNGGSVGTCASDRRLKTNIQAFPPVLERLVRLQPVQFDWRRSNPPEYRFGPGRNSGLIAQEVEKVFPEMVSIDAEGFKQVNYSELPYLMLQAIRELKAENDTLRAQVEELRGKDAKVSELTRQVEELQAAQQQIATLGARLAQLQARTAKARPKTLPAYSGVKGTSACTPTPSSRTLAKVQF